MTSITYYDGWRLFGMVGVLWAYGAVVPLICAAVAPGVRRLHPSTAGRVLPPLAGSLEP